MVWQSSGFPSTSMSALGVWSVSIIIEQTGRLIEKKLSIEPPKTSLETQEVIAND